MAKANLYIGEENFPAIVAKAKVFCIQRMTMIKKLGVALLVYLCITFCVQGLSGWLLFWSPVLIYAFANDQWWLYGLTLLVLSPGSFMLWLWWDTKDDF